MKKAKDMLQTIVKKPINTLKSGSSKAYERYHDLFRSIRKLAHPEIKNLKEKKGNSE